LLLVYLQLLFAVNTKRLLIIGFPAILFLALKGMEALSSRLSLKPLWFVPLFSLLTILNIVYPGYFPFPAFIIQGSIFIVYMTFLYIYYRFVLKIG
jgi:hypothetical protein